MLERPPPAPGRPLPPSPDPQAALHPDVLKLGWVSFLTDLSSEMIFSVFAVVFTTVAGASSALLGLIEGLADFAASGLNYLAGWLSDRSGRRKGLVLAGYGFSTLAKLLLLLSSSLAALAMFRVVERLGKGLRGPPRDAWLASVTQRAQRGYAFGVHKALDKAGAVLAPLLAYGLLVALGESPATYQLLFALACVPACLSLVLLLRVSAPPPQPRQRDTLSQSWAAVSPHFKRYLLPAGLFALSYFSLGFVLLKAHAIGLGVANIVLLYALFNLSCVLCAPGVGRLGDRWGRAPVILLGYAVYAGVNLALIWVDSLGGMAVAMALYGVFYAMDESQNKALIADLEPQRCASAIGIYQFTTGLMYLPASLIAGALWLQSPTWVFGLAAALSLAAAVVWLSGLGPRA